MTTKEKMRRNRQKRECIRSVEDERVDDVNDKGDVRDLDIMMGEKEWGEISIKTLKNRRE